jgi:cell division septal protein FtsQ
VRLVSRKPREPPGGEAVVALPRRAPARPARVPSRRAAVIALSVAVLGVLLYLVARESSAFAVRTIRVEGASPQLARRVEEALRPVEGTSLLALDGAEVSRLATRLPEVADVSYDRAFPNTLRVRVVPEQPVAVLHRGTQAWLVSGTGRVLASIKPGTHAGLPRIWQPQGNEPTLGATLGSDGAGEVAALAAVRGTALARRIQSVQVADGQYTYVLRGAVQLLVGDPTDLALKLAVADQILARTPVVDYLDVSVVERPVARVEPQVSG